MDEVAPLAVRLRPATARRVRRPAARARRPFGAPAGDRGGPPRLGDLLRASGDGEDDAGPDRGRTHGRRVRGAVGGLGVGGRRPGDAHPCARPPGRERAAHDPLSRRDPPVQQGAAGRAPAGRRGGADHVDRLDDGEPLFRGELGAAQPGPGLRPRAAVGRGARGDRRAWRGRARGRGAGGARGADRAPRRRGRPDRAERARARSADRRRRGRADRRTARRGRSEEASAPLRPRRGRALRLRVRVHQVDARARTRTRASTTWRRCSRRARTRGSSRGG